MEFRAEGYTKPSVFAPSGSVNLTVSSPLTPAIAKCVLLTDSDQIVAVLAAYAVLLNK